MNAEIQSIFAQMTELAKQDQDGERRVQHVRVTRFGIPGSIVTMPMTMERARQLGVEFNAGWPPLEILMHYEDWANLRRSIESVSYLQIGEPTKRDRVIGIPVTIDNF